MILPCNWKDGPATNPGTRPANHSLLPEQDRPPNRVDASGHWTKADTRDDLGVPAEGRIWRLKPRSYHKPVIKINTIQFNSSRRHVKRKTSQLEILL